MHWISIDPYQSVPVLECAVSRGWDFAVSVCLCLLANIQLCEVWEV